MKAPTIRESFAEYGRGVVGGLLFTLPLLYTMEVWQVGLTASPLRLLVGLGGTFALLLLYNRFAGMREDATFREVAIDSVEEMALGLGTTTLMLLLTGRLNEGDEMPALIGKIVVCGMMAAIGVSVGTAQLGVDNPQEDEDQPERGKIGEQLAIGLCGAVLVAGNVAPTEEIQRIAFEVTPAMLLGLVVLSLFLAASIAGVCDFRGGRPWGARIAIPDPLFAAVAANGVGMVASVALLAFFGALAGNALSVNVAQTVVLGVPASLGASAGRLLLQA